MCNEQLEFKFYDIYPEQIEMFPLDYPQLNWSVVDDNGFGNFTIKYVATGVTYSLGSNYEE